MIKEHVKTDLATDVAVDHEKARGWRLNRERVVSSAMTIIDECGLSALTMRGLATSLGVEIGAIYHWFDGKSAIIDAVVAEVRAEAIDAGLLAGDDFRAGALALAHHFRTVMLEHPYLVPLMGQLLIDPMSLRKTDELLGHLVRHGFDVGEAFEASNLIAGYIIGTALVHGRIPRSDTLVPRLEQLAERAVPMVATDGLLHVTALGRVLLDRGIDREAEFERGLTALLDGFEPLRHPAGS